MQEREHHLEQRVQQQLQRRTVLTSSSNNKVLTELPLEKEEKKKLFGLTSNRSGRRVPRKKLYADLLLRKVAVPQLLRRRGTALTSVLVLPRRRLPMAMA